MTRNGKPVSNHPFRLWTNYVKGSGGHDHTDLTNNTRVNNDDNYGYFLIGEATQHHRPLDEVTKADGKFNEITYNTSIFGDTMRVYLKSRYKALLCDSISIAEQVTGLILFPDGTYYEKVGGTKEHHGPSDRLPSTSPYQTPDNNHWCTPSFADSLTLVIDDFNDWAISQQGDGNPIIIHLNDMSLPLGGRFDINGNWGGRTSQEHYFHRIGTSVDISKRDEITAEQIEQLTEIMEDHKLFRDPEKDSIHFGFQEGN